MIEVASLAAEVAIEVLPRTMKWLGGKLFDPVMREYSNACTEALAVSLLVMGEDPSDASVSLLADLVLATLENVEFLDAVLFAPIFGTAPESDELAARVVGRFVDRGGDVETAAVDVSELVETFVTYLPGYVHFAAARPESALFGYSVQGQLAEVRKALRTSSPGVQREMARMEGDSARRSTRDALEVLSFSEGESVEGAYNADHASYRSLRASSVHFTSVCSFDNLVVVGPTSFVKCEFEAGASFADSQFLGPVSFRECTFCDPVDFTGTRFRSAVSFEDTVFERGVVFGRQDSSEDSATFEALVVATGSTYGSHADFANVKFGGPFDAERTVGLSSASFSGVQFAQGGSLAGGEYGSGVDFRGITIGHGALDISSMKVDHLRADFGDQETWDRVAGIETLVQHGRLLAPQHRFAPDEPDDDSDEFGGDWQSFAYVERWDDGLLGVPRRQDGH